MSAVRPSVFALAPALTVLVLFGAFALPRAQAEKAVVADAPGPGTPIAVLGGETIHREDVQGAVAFRLYRLEVDAYSLLKGETERRVEQQLLAAEASRRGLSVEAMLAEVEGQAPRATPEEVDAYLAEHPSEGSSGAEVRARVRHYLGERARIERRLALLDRLRAEAGYRFVLAPPVPPRTEVDVRGAPTRGHTEAGVTIVHFANFASRHSARSAARIASLVEEFPGRIRHVHRNFLNGRDERGLLAARIAKATRTPEQFWALHDRWFAARGKLDVDAIERVAREVGLSQGEISDARSDPATLEAVKRDIDAANAAGALREPALFVNGLYVSGVAEEGELRRVVVEELGRSDS